MRLHPTSIKDLNEIESEPFVDERGRFSRLFCEQAFAVIRPELHFAQINLSETRKCGTLRGLHYQQATAAEAKLIRCTRGRVFDVAVDLRQDSATFLSWHAVELAEDNDRGFFIPEGFAHGFQTLSDNVQLLYMHTVAWQPQCEAGLRYDDPRIGIRWPTAVTHISNKDQSYRLLDESFVGFCP